MGSNDSRVGDRQATTSMRIKLKYPDVETFIQKYAVNISRGGIFIATKAPKPIGTYVKFEFLLGNAAGTSLIRGEGQVQWTREFDPKQPTKAHGMGLKFTRLDADSQVVVERALAWRASQAGARKGDYENLNMNVAPPVGSDPSSGPLPLPLSLPEPSVPTRVDALPPEHGVPEDEPTQVRGPDADDGGRKLDEPTREVTFAQAIAEQRGGRPPDVQTREIELPDLPPGETTGEIQLPPLPAQPELKTIDADDSVRIALERHGKRNGTGRSAEDIDQMARDWGISEERLARVLRRPRPKLVEATAELERLLRKPPRGAPPSRAEAMAKLPDLLARRHTPDEVRPPPAVPPKSPEAQAAGGEPESPPPKRKRWR